MPYDYSIIYFFLGSENGRRDLFAKDRKVQHYTLIIYILL